MYKLKNKDNEVNYKLEITDDEYWDLIFYKKWKYTKMNLLVSDYEYLQVASKIMEKHYESLTEKPEYVKASKLPPATTHIDDKPYTKSYQSPPKRNFDDTSFTDNSNNSFTNGLITGIIIDDLLNQPPDIIQDLNQYDGTVTQAPEQFEGFGGGTGGGGGSSGSWDDNNSIQQDPPSFDNTPIDNGNFS